MTLVRTHDSTSPTEHRGRLRVLIWMPEFDRIPGGHCTQVRQTARALEALGVDVDITHQTECDLSPFDLVHGFGLLPEQIRTCRRAGLPVVVSTIYWERSYLCGEYPTHHHVAKWVRRIRTAGSLARAALTDRAGEVCTRFLSTQARLRTTFEMADLLLPNSQLEAQSVRRDLGVTTPFRVVPNAVDPSRFQMPAEHAERNFVLMAGRFEPHKNQLGLIEAMRGSTIPVRLIGPPHPDHPDYYERCKRRARGNVQVLPPVAEYTELARLYQRARVHVLPSWFETTGLVSLEAALCGCGIVTTDRGHAREYFQSMARYCDPASPRSIRKAVEAAFRDEPSTALREHILDRYTWAHTGRATLDAYRLVLPGGALAPTRRRKPATPCPPATAKIA